MVHTVHPSASTTKNATFVVALSLLLTGCSSFFPVRNGTIGASPGIATTAEYRLVSQRTREADPKKQQLITCTEPSPDIAKAYSDALKASGSSGEVSAGLEAQHAEAIAQLGKRYATVQLLRDILYRDCEDYGNGAIDRVEYSFRMSRFGSLVVTLLAIEMVSQDTALNAPATNSPTISVAGDAAPPADKKDGAGKTGGAETPPKQEEAAKKADASISESASLFKTVAASAEGGASEKPAKQEPASKPDQTQKKDAADGGDKQDGGAAALSATQTNAIVALQKEFMKDAALIPITVACAKALEGATVDAARVSRDVPDHVGTAFADYCANNVMPRMYITATYAVAPGGGSVEREGTPSSAPSSTSKPSTKAPPAETPKRAPEPAAPSAIQSPNILDSLKQLR